MKYKKGILSKELIGMLFLAIVLLFAFFIIPNISKISNSILETMGKLPTDKEDTYAKCASGDVITVKIIRPAESRNAFFTYDWKSNDVEVKTDIIELEFSEEIAKSFNDESLLRVYTEKPLTVGEPYKEEDWSEIPVLREVIYKIDGGYDNIELKNIPEGYILIDFTDDEFELQNGEKKRVCKNQRQITMKVID